MISFYYYVPNFQEDTPDLLVKILVKNSRKIQLFDSEGQFVMDRIDKLKLSKSKVLPKDDVKFFYSSLDFYIETVSNGIDITNRPAIIGIYGKIPVLKNGYMIDDWLFSVCDETEKFSKSIDRPIFDLQLDIIKNQLFNIGLQAKSKRYLSFVMKLFIVVIIPIYIAAIINLFFDVNNIIVSGCLISISNCVLTILNRES